jgi:phytoene dehydrogenase-like protein
MSGLAAGIRLAYYNQRVCVLERHTTIGGLNSFYRFSGRDFDVGLHALTNYTAKGTRRGPLAKMLRQLRLRWEDLQLAPQAGSQIAFPGTTLEFNNDIRLLQSQIELRFPSQKQRFQQLLERLIDYDDLRQEDFEVSARQVLQEIFSDPLLIEMLLCPLMWYGNAREHDMDFGQFCIMFRSIFLEGFARPLKGVRLILKALVRKFRELGGQLKLRSGVSRILLDDHRRAIGVELDNGQQLFGRRILSSAGVVETLRLCDGLQQERPVMAGELSFIESISVLDCQPEDIGFRHTIVFFNDSEQFHWARPRDALCDVRTGVICSPNNYLYAGQGQLPEGIVRLTTLADHEAWCRLPEEQYRVEKVRWHEAAVASAVRFMPDYRRHIIETDSFTPRTIRRFTWHDNGAVYGAPDKRLDGTTPIENLYLCGTDQGYVGIIGSIVSGISMANAHCLRSDL